MKTSFELVAETRADKQGKGASRRLRNTGRVPAILYGGHAEPLALSFDHQKLEVALQNERFFTTLLSITIGDKKQAAILKDLQRHPAKPTILHLDLQRVLDNEPIRMTIPLHFQNAAAAPGVKTGGGQVSHLLNEVEVVCLPKDLPESIEIDLADMELGDSKHLSDLKLPAGVEVVLLSHGHDEAIVSVHRPRVEEESPAAEAAAAAAPAGAAPAAAGKPATAAKPAAGAKGAAPAAAPAKGGKK
jgi:large subunit ribosomal protein L25